MANNVVSLETGKAEKKNREAAVENFLIRNRVPLLVIMAVLLAAALAACIIIGTADMQHKKGIAAVDSIEYALTANAAEASESDMAARRKTALDALQTYVEKKNIVGVRASMLAADIYYAEKNYAASLDAWLKAAEAGAKSYTAPVCYFNAASCNEELGNTAEAVKYYALAAAAEDFYLAPHALFSEGRVHEADKDYRAAADVYQKLIDTYTSDNWANLAQSRLITLKLEGKID